MSVGPSKRYAAARAELEPTTKRVDVEHLGRGRPGRRPPDRERRWQIAWNRSSMGKVAMLGVGAGPVPCFGRQETSWFLKERHAFSGRLTPHCDTAALECLRRQRNGGRRLDQPIADDEELLRRCRVPPATDDDDLAVAVSAIPCGIAVSPGISVRVTPLSPRTTVLRTVDVVAHDCQLGGIRYLSRDQDFSSGWTATMFATVTVSGFRRRR